MSNLALQSQRTPNLPARKGPPVLTLLDIPPRAIRTTPVKILGHYAVATGGGLVAALLLAALAPAGVGPARALAFAAIAAGSSFFLTALALLACSGWQRVLGLGLAASVFSLALAASALPAYAGLSLFSLAFSALVLLHFSRETHWRAPGLPWSLFVTALTLAGNLLTAS